MAMEMARNSLDIADFKDSLQNRIITIKNESGLKQFSFPVGLFFVIDEENGGDATAVQLVRRFHLLDRESKNFIDFYYLGWDDDDGFELDAFEDFRNFLKHRGISMFGGNADLILVDLDVDHDHTTLRFDRAIMIDLSERVSRENQSLGKFLQDLVAAAEKLDRITPYKAESGAVYAISDTLGIAYAKTSFIRQVLEKWGSIIGAAGLKDLAVQKIGPQIALEELG